MIRTIFLFTCQVILLILLSFSNHQIYAIDTSPQVQFTIPQTGLCPDQQIEIENKSNPDLNYSWFLDGNIISNKFHLRLQNISVGQHTLTLKADSSGITGRSTQYLTIQNPPGGWHWIQADTFACHYQQMDFIVHGNTEYTYNLWDATNNVSLDEKSGYSSTKTLTIDSITSSGPYIIKAKNSCTTSNIDTFTIRLKNTPPRYIISSFTPPLICNSGAPVLKIDSLADNSIYEVAIFSGNYEDITTPGKIEYQLPVITRSRGYDIRVTDTISGCFLKYKPQIVVDTIIPNVKIPSVNQPLGKVFRVSNSSYGNPTIKWDFGDDAKTKYSKEETVMNSYSSIGVKKIQLLNQSARGCTDSIAYKINIYREDIYPDAGWAINGSKIENWMGHHHIPSFDVGIDQTVYFTSMYKKDVDSCTVFHSYHGIDLEIDKPLGTAGVGAYNKYGHLKWFTEFSDPYNKRFLVSDLKYINDSTIIVSCDEKNPWTPHETENGETEQKIDFSIYILNTEGEIRDTLINDYWVWDIETDQSGNIYFLCNKNFPEYERENYNLRKFSPAMEPLWTIDFYHSYYNNSEHPQIAFDYNDNVFIEGMLTQDMEVISTDGPHIIQQEGTPLSSFRGDVYLFKINKNGAFLWSNLIHSERIDIPVNLFVDSEGNAYINISHSFNPQTTFTSVFLPDTTVINGHFAKYTSNGNFDKALYNKINNNKTHYSAPILVSQTSDSTFLGYNSEQKLLSLINFDTSLNVIHKLTTAQSHLNISGFKSDKHNHIYALTYNNSFQYPFEIINNTLNLDREEYLIVKMNSFFSSDTVFTHIFDTMYCSFNSIELEYEYRNLEQKEYEFQVELSDKNGSFQQSTLLKTFYSKTSKGVINCQFPSNISDGKYYRIRINNKSTGSIGKDNGHDILITSLQPSRTENAQLCINDSLFIFNEFIKSPGTYTFSKSNPILCDSIIIFNVTDTKGTKEVHACSSYQLSNGNLISESGTYTDVKFNDQGCDSLLTILLTITSIDTTVTRNNFQLTANDVAASYEWTSCENREVLHNNREFKPSQSGFYSVILHKNGCIDSSSCWNLNIMEPADTSHVLLKVYPNPTPQDVFIDFGKEVSNVEMVLSNVLGQRIKTFKFDTGTIFKIPINFRTGTFILEIYLNKEQLGVYKILKTQP